MYDEALEQLEEASKHIDVLSPSYKRCMYYKSLTLIANYRINEGLACIEYCLSMVDGDLTKWTLIYIALLEAQKYSMSLSNEESVEYLKTNAIPKLVEFGLYVEAIHYYQLIRNHYRYMGNREKALGYSYLIEDVYKLYINAQMELL